MAERKSTFLYPREIEKYPYPPECPFNTSRPQKARKILKSMGLLSGENISEIDPGPADRISLKKFHSAKYLHILKNASRKKSDIEAMRMGLGTEDCPIFEGMYEYSSLACGATLAGAELIITGKTEVAFNASGGLHHAMPERASGFCYMNDMALACIVLAEAGKKVLYLDIDVHHGDGVAYAFYDRADIMTISLHQSGRSLFPGTGFEDEIGTGDGKGYCINLPLPVGTYDEAYMRVFVSVAVPLIKTFEPDVFVFELGADGLAGDPLANLCLTNNVYAEIIEYLLGFNKPILATGGGGYNIDNTARAWALAWSIFAKADSKQDMNLGSGGVMLESTDWQGGFRDRELAVNNQQRDAVRPVIEATIETVKKKVFSIHGLTAR